MKNQFLPLVIILSLTSCGRIDNNYSSSPNVEGNSILNKAIEGGGGSDPIFASYNSNMTYSTTLSCPFSLSPIQIVIDPNLPIISKPLAVFGQEPFLSYVKIDYGALNVEVAKVIFSIFNTPNIQQYSTGTNEYSNYITNYNDPRKQLYETEVSFGQDATNAGLYGTIFPYDKFMNQNIANTMSHKIINQIKDKISNSHGNVDINLKAIETYKDSFLCNEPYHYLKVRIAYTMN